MPRVTAFHRDLRSYFPDADPHKIAEIANRVHRFWPLAKGFGKEVDDILNLANEAINGFDVEAIRDNKWEHYYLDIGILYVNTGDTYSATVLYDTRKGKFYVTTYGDYIEAEEHRGRRFQ